MVMLKMKSYIPVFVVGFFLSCFHIQASEIRVHLQEPSSSYSADIHRVKIYADQVAELVHHMTVIVENPKEGIQDLIVDGFPNSLIDHSIQIVSTNDIDVFDHKVSHFSYPIVQFPYLQDQIKSLRARISELNNALSGIKSQEETFKRRQAQLEDYIRSRFSSNSGTNGLATNDFLELMNFQENESNKINSKLLILLKDKEQKQDEFQTLQEKLQRLLNPNQLFNEMGGYYQAHGQTIEEKQLQIRLNIRKETLKADASSSSTATKSIKLEFFFRYFVQPADWTADYLISIQSMKDSKSRHLASSSSASYIREKNPKQPQKDYKMEITQYADVSQSTGMDWENVDLLLTTSRPQYIGTIPFPVRKVVYFQPQAQAYMMASAPMMPRVKRSRGKQQAKMMMMEASDGNFEQEDMASFGGAAPMAASVSSMATATVQSNNVGGVDYSYVYHVQNLVNITSKWNPRRALSLSGTSSTSSLPPHNYHHSMLIKTLTLPIDIFMYIAPAIDTNAHRVAFGKFPIEESPLIPSFSPENTRIEIGDEYTGTTTFSGMQSGQYFHQNLGSDSLVKVSYLTSVPTNSQMEEDKSTWFVKDSVKYKLINEEKTITVKNSHMNNDGSADSSSSSADMMLFIVVDSIPSSSEEKDIKVTLLSPATEDIVTLSDQVLQQKRNDEDFLSVVLEQEYEKKAKNELVRKQKGSTTILEKDIVARTVYLCKSSGNVFWAVWVKPTATEFVLSLKYKIIRPFDKEVYIY